MQWNVITLVAIINDDVIVWYEVWYVSYNCDDKIWYEIWYFIIPYRIILLHNPHPYTVINGVII